MSVDVQPVRCISKSKVLFAPKRCTPKRLIAKDEWVKLMPYIRQRLNIDGCTYEFLGKELGEKYGGKGAALTRSRIEQVVKWLNANHEAGIKLRKRNSHTYADGTEITRRSNKVNECLLSNQAKEEFESK